MAVNDLVVGAWRNGLHVEQTLPVVNEIEQRHKAGFRLGVYDRVVFELCQLLDAYDEFATEMLENESVQREVASDVPRVDDGPTARTPGGTEGTKRGAKRSS